jgi:inorganic pyrophosphatase
LLLRREIVHFFEVYKDLDPGRYSDVKGWGDIEEAWDRIASARKNFASGQAI